MSVGTDSDYPEKQWTNPFTEGTWLYNKFDETVRQHKDFIILFDDSNADRGTGKTVGSLHLANGMDQTAEGMTIDKAALQPEEIRNAYVEQPKRSGLVLDEAEYGASNRESMTKTNKALREVMSMGRVMEKYIVVNAPTISFIDKDLRKLAHCWMSMTRKGQAIVHALEWEPYSERLLRPKKQLFEFEDIPTGTDLRDVYNKLAGEKRRILSGSESAGFVPEDDHQKAVKKASEEARREERNRFIRQLAHHPVVESSKVNQKTIAECADVDPSLVSKLLRNGDG